MFPSRSVSSPRLHATAVALPVMALALGCGQDAKSGALTVSYLLGPAAECSDFNVQKVQATLGDPDDGLEEDAACGNDVIFSGVDEGTYNLVVEATDPQRFVVMDNWGDEDSQMVEILGDAERDVQAQLTETPVRVWVRWSLFNTDGDFPVMCGDSAVEEFEVTAWKDASDLHSETFECTAPADDSDDQYRYLEDEMRDIDNTITDVTVTPQGPGLNHDPIRFTFEPPGPGRTLKFTVTCNGDACTGKQD